MKTLKLTDYLVDMVERNCDELSFNGVSIDSRSLIKGNLFFALKGTNSDGNNYAQSALDAGAIAVVVDSPDIYKQLTGNKVLVKNSLAALIAMGKKRTTKSGALRIAITGSFGKTTTKELIVNVLSQKFKVYASKGNYNNELGVALTACTIDDTADIHVYELGSNAPGEISALSRYIRPHIAVITGVGHAHVGRFGSLDKVAEEKISIIDGLTQDGVIVVNESLLSYIREDRELSEKALSYGYGENADFKISDSLQVTSGMMFSIRSREGISDYIINHPYPHFVENAAAAIVCGKLLEMDYADIKSGIESFKPLDGRGILHNIGELTILDDCYNASLESIEKAVEALSLYNKFPKYALIGEMKEIEGHEDELYERLIDKAAEYKDIKFLMSGDNYKKYSESSNITVLPTREDTIRALKMIDKGVILVKASNSCRFDEYVKLLINKCGKHDL